MSKTINLVCCICGKTFLRLLKEHNKSIKNGTKNTFCSMDCLYKHRSENSYVDISCSYCKKQIRRRRKYIEKYDSIACSKECKYKIQQKTKIKLKCDECKKEIFRTMLKYENNF